MKIVQISTLNDSEGGGMIIGLGEDGNVYVWNRVIGTWRMLAHQRSSDV